MNIVEYETLIELSEEEKQAFQKVSDIFEEIVKKTNDPFLIAEVMMLNKNLVEFVWNHCEEEIE